MALTGAAAVCTRTWRLKCFHVHLWSVPPKCSLSLSLFVPRRPAWSAADPQCHLGRCCPKPHGSPLSDAVGAVVHAPLSGSLVAGPCAPGCHLLSCLPCPPPWIGAPGTIIHAHRNATNWRIAMSDMVARTLGAVPMRAWFCPGSCFGCSAAPPSLTCRLAHGCLPLWQLPWLLPSRFAGCQHWTMPPLPRDPLPQPQVPTRVLWPYPVSAMCTGFRLQPYLILDG
jgi:hypothetical protein